MKFSQVKYVRIPNGSVRNIRYGENVLWMRSAYYVSLGDSIAAGEAIRNEADLYTPYCWAWQYGTWTNDAGVTYNNTETTIITDSYTDLIGKEVKRQYGNKGYVKSFARSGDTVADLLDKLRDNNGNNPVTNALKEANIVTVCIGANDVLQTALANLSNYINEGAPALSAIGAAVQTNLDILDNDNNINSYASLLKELNGINPNAKYVFTTVYNPLKYFWAEESTEANDYKDGVFGPLMWAIPFSDLTNPIRGALYNTDAVQMVFDRINGVSRDGSDGLAAFTETYITKLNDIIKDKIDKYKNPNFIVADTKTLYDSFPDRPIPANVHYNDLVNVEITRGFTIQDMDWGQFWANFSWTDLINSPEVVMETVMTNVVNNVVLPDVNPHPETDGQYALYRSFADALGWQSLNRYTITFNSNGGSGSMAKQEVVGIGSSVYTILKNNVFVPMDTYRFDGWKDQNGNTYAEGQGIFITSDLTLYAQWSNLYVLTYTHSQGDVVQTGSNETGPMDYYQLWVAGTDNNIAGNPEGKLGAFSNPPVYYMLPYGTSVGVVVGTELGEGRSYITFNGDPVSGKSSYESYDFTITGNTVVNFEWNQWQSTDPSDYVIDFGQVSYWNCYIKTK